MVRNVKNFLTLEEEENSSLEEEKKCVFLTSVRIPIHFKIKLSN